MDRIILETDCPYLAPLPHRGRRNEPAFIADVHRFFCAWKGAPQEGVATAMEDNFHRLFAKVMR
jgi:TatD DNase family protein